MVDADVFAETPRCSIQKSLLSPPMPDHLVLHQEHYRVGFSRVSALIGKNTLLVVLELL
jgi:hypothetical protein